MTPVGVNGPRRGKSKGLGSDGKGMLIVNRRIRIPLREFRFSYARSRGPGGQNVNKVNTKVSLHWSIDSSPSLPDDVRDRFRAKYPRRINKRGAVVISSERYRDQARNQADCLEKLRQMVLAVAIAPKKRKATRPTAGSKERRLQDKKQRSQKKHLRRNVPDD